MTYHPDEHDLEHSHELEQRLDRDAERESYRRRRARPPRDFSGRLFRPVANATDEREAA